MSSLFQKDTSTADEQSDSKDLSRKVSTAEIQVSKLMKVTNSNISFTCLFLNNAWMHFFFVLVIDFFLFPFLGSEGLEIRIGSSGPNAKNVGNG
jgi:hypothetical protein